MAYIAGNPLLTVSRFTWEGSATAGQNSISIPGGYTPGMVDVFVGGAALSGIINGVVTDFNDSSGTAIVLTQAMSAGTQYRVNCFAPGSVVPSQQNSVQKTGDTMTGPLTFSSGGILVFADGSKQGSAAVGRNRLINGDFRVNQKGGGTTVVNAISYLVDRWGIYSTGAAVAANNNWGNPNYQGGTGNSLAINGAAGNTSTNLLQRIEAANIADLAGKQVTLSGWMYRTAGGSVSVYNTAPPTLNNWTSQTVQNFGTVTLAPQTWTFFRYSAFLQAGCTNGCQIEFDNANLVANDNFAITDIQLEAGNNPNPIFERRDFGEELVRCQRYYYQLVVNQFQANFPTVFYNTTSGYAKMYLPVTMRASPAGSVAGSGTWYRITNGSVLTSVVFNQIMGTEVVLQLTAPSGQAITADMLSNSSTNPFTIMLNAEL